MKLKPIVASLMLLGLAAPAFADGPSMMPSAATQVQLDQMKAQLNKMQAIINQNSEGYFQQQCDWASRIALSGELNVDGTWGNRSPQNFGKSVSNIAVNNANIFLDAAVNDWTNVHFNLRHSDNLSDAITPASLRNGTHFDEAYVTLGNFTESPFYARAGREFVPFGVYDPYAMVMNPTQLLSQTQATAFQLGFVSSDAGVYGSAYGFQGVDSHTNAGSSVENGIGGRPIIQSYGADLGYVFCSDVWGLKLDAGYLRNMADTWDMENGALGAGGASVPFASSAKVSAMSLHAGLNYAAFDIKGDWVQALTSFRRQDIIAAHGGAKPAAWGVEAGYSFPVVNLRPSRLAAGYQSTHDTQNVGDFGIPKSRIYASYVVNISKLTDLGFEVYHDKDYSKHLAGSTGGSATVGVVRLGVKFA